MRITAKSLALPLLRGMRYPLNHWLLPVKGRLGGVLLLFKGQKSVSILMITHALIPFLLHRIRIAITKNLSWACNECYELRRLQSRRAICVFPFVVRIEVLKPFSRQIQYLGNSTASKCNNQLLPNNPNNGRIMVIVEETHEGATFLPR